MRHPSNKLLECHYHSDKCLHLKVRNCPDISFLIHAPVRLVIYHFLNGTPLCKIALSSYNLTDAVMLLMPIISYAFEVPMPNLTIGLNPELHFKLLFDFGYHGTCEQILIKLYHKLIHYFEMYSPVSNHEITRVLEVIKHSTNDILDCQVHKEIFLYLSVKDCSEISFLITIPVDYPFQRLTVCQLSNGAPFGEVVQTNLTIMDVVMLLMAFVCNEFRKPMPGVAVQLNPELYQKWLYDFNNEGPFRSFLIS
ncbi:unnamed protein product [Rodentolepis nana]|uniref:Mab-21 domain-containing protein n=1 Tax=Rodentolepis nana TaxID=102285 RepID=A0A0R3TG65_RODNA|nr:unnamed protein product [Rodentolepis nana]